MAHDDNKAPLFSWHTSAAVIDVLPLTNGSYRNHCPTCLHSKHVDLDPGDRVADCRGLMRPHRIEHRRGKGRVIVHLCLRCGFTRPDRVAEDLAQGDDIEAVIAVMTVRTG
jgi:hypothetical protein